MSKMTTPLSPVSAQEDNQSLKYEAQVQSSLVGDLISLVASTIKTIIKASATLEGDELKAAVIAAVSKLKPSVPKSAINSAVMEGLKLGVEQSGFYEDMDIPTPKRSDVSALTARLGKYDKPLKDSARNAIKLAKSLPADKDYVDTMTTAVKGVEIKAKQLSNYVAGLAQAEGVKLVAKSNGSRIMWVHEQNACLHCLALTGKVINPDSTFPKVTYADKPLKLATDITGPPLHPNCRCRLRVWDGKLPRNPADIPKQDNNTSFAEALQREARRSVLRGDSNYDSKAQRLRAADKLLHKGANLPVSVERRAARAVKQGEFAKRSA